MRAAADRSDQTERQIYAVLRFTVMARDAGFNELAQNIWQGLLEVHFGAHSKGDLAERLQRVEDLWDSEASKIGDPVGQTRGKVQAIHTNIAEWSTSTPMQGRASISWAEQEVRLSKQQAGAGANASNSEDPLSIILFQDIQPFLFTVPSDKELIVVDAFLTFSGLPLLAADCPVPSSKWQTDPFIFGRPPSCSVSGGALDEQTILRPIPRTLLSRHHHHFKISDPAFVRRVLAHISHVRPQLTPLAEYYMAFMAHNFPDEARQEAKKVLKHSPLDLRLYNAMGLMEGVLGNPGAADKVLSSALQMCGKLSLAQQDDEVLLRLSWIWQAIAGQDSSTALARLRKVSEGAPAFEKLIQGRDRSMSRSQYHQACAYSEMLALEPYLVHDFDLASALAAFQGEAQHLISSDNGSAYSIELLHQARAMLIQHHVSHLKHFSPSLIRGALRQSVLRFPNNTPFLHLFMDNEARFIVDNRTRSSTRDVVLSDEPNVVSYTAYLQHQIRSLERFGATQHSIRSDFEQALASNHGKYSKTLWTMYFFFEVQVIHDWRRAKAVYYRGLNSVPWSKDFALLAFERLADVFEEGEYGEIYGLMQDRGMRLRAEWPEAT